MLPSVHRSSLPGCFSGHPRMDLSLDFIHADFWSAHDMKHQHASQTASTFCGVSSSEPEASGKRWARQSPLWDHLACAGGGSRG